MTGQQIITCKKCGSNKVEVKSSKQAAFALLMTAGVLTVFIVTIPVALIFYFLSFMAMIAGNGSAKCTECKKSQVISKEKLQEYKRYEI